MIDIDLVDHIITSGDQFFSFSAQNLISRDCTKENAYAAQYATAQLSEEDT